MRATHSNLLVRAAQTHLILNQEIMIDIDDPTLACVSSGTWKTSYYPLFNLCEGILQWRVDRKPIQTALRFMTPDDREFLLSGLTPAAWNAMFHPDDIGMRDDIPF